LIIEIRRIEGIKRDIRELIGICNIREIGELEGLMGIA